MQNERNTNREPQAAPHFVGGPVDQNHNAYWRQVDNFFRLEPDAEVLRHVTRIYGHAYTLWIRHFENGTLETGWLAQLTGPDLAPSIEFLQRHQRRFVERFYAGKPTALFDSFWKFAADALPHDPEAGTETHTMEGTSDWLYWLPYLDATLRLPGTSELDLVLARAWQVGVVSEGLHRKRDRPVRIDEVEFADFPGASLFERVQAKYARAGADELQRLMQTRLLDIPNH